MIRKSEISVASLFSGCGGLDYGFESANYNVCFYNDNDKHSCQTLRDNGKRGIIEAPIEEISTSEVQNIVGYSKNALDVLIGGPPCQPFSKSAYWSQGDTLRLKDPRANTLDHYFRFVEELRPRVFLLENVHGLNYSGKEEGFQFVIQRIRDINQKHGLNYVPEWKVINVADYGVPQLRVRFFLVASRTGKRFSFPQPSHMPDNEMRDSLFGDLGLRHHVTTWEAIGNIPVDDSKELSVGGKWADLLPTIPEGENYLWHTDRKGGLPLFGWRTRYWSFLLKLAKNLPSWTIQAQPGSAVGPFHWGNRKLSWQEMAAIQTFPKTFVINVPRTEVQRQIGNAVPSLMAEVLALNIAQQYFSKSFKKGPKLAVSTLSDIPPPEPVRKVPKKYMSLVGNHAAHPGTGMGKKASNRNAANSAIQPTVNIP